MIKWDTDLKKAPKGVEPFLLKVNNGLFSGGWSWHKALRVHDQFFNVETNQRIEDPHSWAKVDL